MTPSLYYQSTGPADAPSILFLHGGGAAGWMWDKVVALLPEYHCLVPDLPESGQSADVKPFTMLRAAQECADLIRREGHGGKAVLVGLSEGAQAALQLLVLAPEVVSRAVISSALVLPIAGMGMMASPAVLAWSYRMTVPPFRNSDWWIRLNMKYSAGFPEAYYPQFKAGFQAMTESQFVNMMLENQRFRLPDGLGCAAAPALVIAGKREYGAMKASARAIAAALPNARAMLLDLGAGSSLAKEHNWAITAPALFAQTARAWIEDTPLPHVLCPFA